MNNIESIIGNFDMQSFWLPLGGSEVHNALVRHERSKTTSDKYKEYVNLATYKIASGTWRERCLLPMRLPLTATTLNQ